MAASGRSGVTPVSAEALPVGRRIWVWVSGPVMLLLFSVSVFLVVYLIATWPGGDSADPSTITPASWGRAMGIMADVGRPGLSEFFGSTAIVATFIVAAAAAIGFGAGEARLHPIAGSALLASLVVGVLLVVGVAVMAVPVAVVDVSQTPRVIIVLILAWMTQLMVHGVGRFIDPRQRAEQELQAATRRAQQYGVAGTGEEPRSTWAATVVQIALPLPLWLLTAVFALWVARVDGAWWPMLLRLALVAAYPNLLLSMLWRGTADLSLKRGTVVAARVIGLTLAGGGALALVIALLSVPALSVLGLVLALFTLAHALLLFARTHPPFRPLADLSERVTQRSLARRRRRLQAVIEGERRVAGDGAATG